MRAMDITQRLAEVDAQIADTELRIVQQQKRVENLIARGVDASDMRSTIGLMTETLAHLEAHRAERRRHRRSSA